jgi:hypothetical protein
MDSMAGGALLAERQLLVAWHHSEIVVFWGSDFDASIVICDSICDSRFFEFGHSDFCTGCAVTAAVKLWIVGLQDL